MPPSRACWRTSLAVSLLCALPLGAQELQGAPVEIVSDPDSRAAPAAATTVIDTARFGGEVRSVAEMLASSPGVTIHALGGPGQAATLSLRGASADQSLVLLDGIPLQGPGGGSVDLATLPASLVGRMLVSRGVLGAQLGLGALGGAVELQPRTSREERSGGAQLSYGSFTTGQMAADVESPAGAGSAVLAVQLDHTAGDYAYARQLTPEVPGDLYGYVRENADASRGSVLGRVAQRLGDAELDVLAQGSLGNRGLPGPAPSITPRSRELDQGGVTGLRLRGIAGETAWSVRAWGRLDRIVLRGVTAFGDCADGTPSCPRLDQRSSAARAEAEVGQPAGGHYLRATLSGGAELASGTGTGAHSRGLATLALADDVSFGALALHPALRADVVGSATYLSPGLTASYALGPFELRGGAGLSYRPPSFSELYLDSGGVTGNPQLVAERAVAFDAGLSWRNERLTLRADAFTSRWQDLILYELYPPAKVKPFNIGRAAISGLELAAVLQLGGGFTAETAYSILHAIQLQDPVANQPLPYRPPHRLFARLAHHSDRLEGYGELSFTSRTPRDVYGSSYLAAQLLLNAGVGARAAGPLWLDVEAKNLLDDRTLEDFFQYPLPGLSIAVIARARI